MKLRFDLNINCHRRGLLLCPREDETWEHAAMRLCGIVFFWSYAPVAEAPMDMPAMENMALRADLVGFDSTGEITLWAECGETDAGRMSNLVKRVPSTARLALLAGSHAEGKKFRQQLDKKVRNSGRVEVLAWQEHEFLRWVAAMKEDNFIVGEADGRSLNLVFNDIPFAVDLKPF